jgi:hypothetical protein
MHGKDAEENAPFIRRFDGSAVKKFLARCGTDGYRISLFPTLALAGR